MSNQLFYGDNLGYLREMGHDSVDLVYLDPPFNSNSNYNVLFRSKQGISAVAQTTAFKDTWQWDTPAAMAYNEVLTSGSEAAIILRALKSVLSEDDLMAYLAMMTPRLMEMHRILRPAGGLYLHCDPSAAHYLKLILDAVFGRQNFRSEIVWRRSASHNTMIKQFGPTHDCILFYAKSELHRLRPVFTPHSKEYLRKEFRYEDARGRYRVNEIMGPDRRSGDSGRPWKGFDPSAVGRHWAVPESVKRLLTNGGQSMTLHEQLDSLLAMGELVMSKNGRPKYKQRPTEGVCLQDIWAYQPGTEGCLQGTEKAIDRDVKWLDSEEERIGYPTQKPLGLLERIIKSSSDEGQVVLDPFCGCGTTVEAAQHTKRAWIGIDITHHAIDVIEGRLKARYPNATYHVDGRPHDADSALKLARESPYEFQWWANWKIGVQNYRERKKGADRGIDGIMYFYNPPQGTGQLIISVKAGQNVGPEMIAALAGTMQRDGAEMGLFVCAAKPTDRMRRDAAGLGVVRVGRDTYQKVQIVTATELAEGKLPPLPTRVTADAFQQSMRASKPTKTLAASPQLSLALPLLGGKKKNSEVEDHFSGEVLGRLGLS